MAEDYLMTSVQACEVQERTFDAPIGADWHSAVGETLAYRSLEGGDIALHAMDPQHGLPLLQRRYAARGYRLGGVPASMTLGAFWQGRLVSTVGLRRDQGNGLVADRCFGQEMAALRADGLRLCEFTRLACEPQGPSKLVMASLFHLAYLQALHHWGAEYLVIEVNPRHQAFYQRMLGFQPHGEQRLHRGVGAPAVLMSLSLAWGTQQVRRLGGSLGEGERSRTLFPYFFAPEDEPLLLSRLAAVYGRD